MATSIACPSGERLAAFRRGSLPGEALEAVSKHLLACPLCRQALRASTDKVPAAAPKPDSGRHTETVSAAPDAGDETHSKASPTRVPDDPPVVRSLAREEAPVPAPESPPSFIGPYQLIREVGRGGMGAVYQAIHIRLKKWVAVKVLPAARVHSPEAVARFHREMEALGGLAHPNIVGATDAGEAGGLHFLVMEYVDGVDLSGLVRLCGPLAVADAAEIIRQAATGLQYIHENGRVHRDVKPSNLMLTAAGEVKILDLGLALLHGELQDGEELTASGAVMGTADYMAPEQWDDSHRVDIRADVYSLGCTLYKLLTGKAPFGASAGASPIPKRIRHAQLPVPQIDARPDLPEPLRAVLFRMLAKAPEDRFGTPAEVAEAMRPFTAGCDLRRLIAEARRDKGSGVRSQESGVRGQGPGRQGDKGAREQEEPKRSSTPSAPFIAPCPPVPAGRRRFGWRAALAAALAGTVALAAVLTLAFWPPHPQGPAEPPPRPPRIVPLPLDWPGDRNSEWRWDAAHSELRVQCDREGMIRLGQAPGEDYEIRIDLYQTQWGDAGLFFGRHPGPADGKPCEVFQVIALTRIQINGGQEKFFIQWTERHQRPDGAASFSDAALAPVPAPDKGDQKLSITVKEGKLCRVGWNGKDLLPALRATPSPAPQLLPLGLHCTGDWGAYSCLSAAFFRNPLCLSPGDS